MKESKRPQSVDVDRHNVEALEIHLQRKIQQMVKQSGLAPGEWDVNETLARTLKTLPTSAQIEDLKAVYRQLIDTAEVLQVSIDPKFFLFAA